MSETDQNEQEVALFGSTDHEVESITEEGSLVEAVSFGWGRDIVLVATDEGLFPFDPYSSEMANNLREAALGTNEDGEIVVPEVTLRGGPVYFEDGQGNEEQVGVRKRYNGDGYNPSNPNPGNIEIVHRYQDSGSMVLTNQNPDGDIFRYQNHGGKLLELFQVTQDPDAASPQERIELRNKILVQLKAAWGDSVAVDLQDGSFEPVGDDVDAEKAGFFKESVKAAILGEAGPNTVAADDSDTEGLPGL